MSLDLAFDDAQQAIGDAIGQFCRDRCKPGAAPDGSLPLPLWRELAGLGVLGLATPEGEGGAQELVAALEALGRAVFPGPLAATFLAAQLLPEAERAAVTRGDALVSLGVPPLMPFAPLARIFVALDGERAFLAEPRGEIEAVTTLGGEPWGRVELARGAELGPTGRAFALGDLARAAYLVSAADGLLDAAVEHARTRRQFGHPIGEFQAVAHPLADCSIRLGAAATLARAAAFRFDAGPDAAAPQVRAASAGARLSAESAALETASVCHQVFGAVGITLEGPAFRFSRRIRQLVSEPPGPEASRRAVLAPFVS